MAAKKKPAVEPVEVVEEKEPPRFDPFPRDTYLRECGFQIASRPKHGEAIWQRRGVWLPEHKAIEVADGELPVVEIVEEPKE